MTEHNEFKGKQHRNPEVSGAGVRHSGSSDRDKQWPTRPGLGAFAADKIEKITDTVESIHSQIDLFAKLSGAAKQGKTVGVNGFVYNSIRSVTNWVGAGIDALELAPEKPGDPAWETWRAIVNGVFGDQLHASRNQLTIPMMLRQQGVALSNEQIAQAIQDSDGTLLIWLHGSCMHDLQWRDQRCDYDRALQEQLGLRSAYLHYNTGLHISENGRLLADYLERLYSRLLQKPNNIVLVGHSMGGLVARSACYYGEQGDHQWRSRLKQMICLGSPHHGAMLERGGNLIDQLLQLSQYSGPLTKLSKERSCGVTDLRYGNIIDEDWLDRDRFELEQTRRRITPLPDDVACYAVAATLASGSSAFNDHLLGDGLVTVNSALGRHDQREHCLAFADSRCFIARKLSHTDLLRNPDVLAFIKVSLAEKI